MSGSSQLDCASELETRREAADLRGRERQRPKGQIRDGASIVQQVSTWLALSAEAQGTLTAKHITGSNGRQRQHRLLISFQTRGQLAYPRERR